VIKALWVCLDIGLAVN